MCITVELCFNPFRAMFTVAQRELVPSSRQLVLSFPFFQSTIISCCHKVLTEIADNKTRAKQTKV